MNKRYFLFGEYAVRSYYDNQDSLTPLIVEEWNKWGYTTCEFNDPCDPMDVLGEYDGWNGFAELTKEEYDFINLMR